MGGAWEKNSLAIVPPGCVTTALNKEGGGGDGGEKSSILGAGWQENIWEQI